MRISLVKSNGLLRCLSGKESTCQGRRCGFSPCVGEIPWRKERLPTPGFLPGESHGQRSLAGCSPGGHKSRTRLRPGAHTQLGSIVGLIVYLVRKRHGARACSVTHGQCRENDRWLWGELMQTRTPVKADGFSAGWKAFCSLSWVAPVFSVVAEEWTRRQGDIEAAGLCSRDAQGALKVSCGETISGGEECVGWKLSWWEPFLPSPLFHQNSSTASEWVSKEH